MGRSYGTSMNSESIGLLCHLSAAVAITISSPSMWVPKVAATRFRRRTTLSTEELDQRKLSPWHHYRVAGTIGSVQNYESIILEGASVP